MLLWLTIELCTQPKPPSTKRIPNCLEILSGDRKGKSRNTRQRTPTMVNDVSPVSWLEWRPSFQVGSWDDGNIMTTVLEVCLYCQPNTQTLRTISSVLEHPSALMCANATHLAAKFVFWKDKYIKLRSDFSSSNRHRLTHNPTLESASALTPLHRHKCWHSTDVPNVNILHFHSPFFAEHASFGRPRKQMKLENWEVLTAQGSALPDIQATGLCPEDNRDASGFHQFTNLKQM